MSETEDSPSRSEAPVASSSTRPRRQAQSTTPATPADEAFDLLGGMMVAAHAAGLVALGLRLGLYRAMAGQGPLTSNEVAERAGLDERWVREWLHAQSAARVVDYAGDGRFEVTDAVAALLADESSILYLGGSFTTLPNHLSLLPRFDEAFHTGLGLAFDDRGLESAQDSEVLMGNWYRQVLISTALPQLEGVISRLHQGAVVADVGCGSGIALLEMAQAFPTSTFHGYDVSVHALERAESHSATLGAGNVTFHRVDTDPLPDGPMFDLVTTFDCLHDMTRPGETVKAIRKAMVGDGTWFIVDIDCAPTFEQNLRRRRFATMLYSTSVYSCLSSALSEPGGAGLGTCGLPEPALRKLVGDGGFGRFRRLDIEHPINAFYEVRP
jgi:2-polyprenyl-3-methyl-5-hydroxy-6-metoxy-1,4-benzoquinol methylase